MKGNVNSSCSEILRRRGNHLCLHKVFNVSCVRDWPELNNTNQHATMYCL